MLKKSINATMISIRKVLFPDMCFVCKDFIDVDKPTSIEDLVEMERDGAFKTVLKDVLCETCLKTFTSVTPPYCSRCGAMFKSKTAENHLCPNCIDKKSKVRRIRSVGIYEEALLELVHKFKYNGKVGLADTFGKMLFLLYMDMVKDESYDMIVPIPLYRSRFRKRGFNQAYLVLKNWNQYTQSVINRDVLLRTRKTETQIGLSNIERRRNLKNAFEAKDSVKNRRILLVDDVYTTGATVESCAGVLAKKGADVIDVITMARTGNLHK